MTSSPAAQKYDTRPMLDTIIERLNTVAQTVEGLRAEMRAGFAAVNQRLEDFDVRFDRMESDVAKTRSEMLTLRADFKEFRAHFKGPA